MKDKLLEAISKHENVDSKDEFEVPRYIRINSEVFTSGSARAFLEEKGFQEVPTPDSYQLFLRRIGSLKKNEYLFDFHVPYLIVFNRKAKLDALPYISFIRQDKSSCLVSLLLAPVPGATLLDMCAAPGYKTQHAASLIHNIGKIYSVDINKERFKTLEKTCSDFGLSGCVVPLNMDGLRTSEATCPHVEYIIVDPPCSGTGMANVLVEHKADLARLRKLHNLQAMLLKHGLRDFPRARRLVYSTCSVKEAENEGVVAECLDTAREEGWQLVSLATAFRGSFAGTPAAGSIAARTIRLSPEISRTNGFYIALFERSVPPDGTGPVDGLTAPPADTQEEQDSSEDEESSDESPSVPSPLSADVMEEC